ncbi:MAG TPA: hypothetical protein VGZ90_07760 [Puia sp.]|jgi:hypothetical protein|nr:hypothetical protein [Puia sp.]
MQSGKKPHVAILALEAEINRYTKLLDKSFADKEVLEKTKIIFHNLKILTEKLAELKTATRDKKVACATKKLRIVSAHPLQKQAS